MWGVGTHLVTAKDQPAFDGVYKLSAIKDEKGKWQHKLKISEQLVKMTNPGILQVRRFEERGSYIADMIYDTLTGFSEPVRIVEPNEAALVRTITKTDGSRDLLEPILKNGQLVKKLPSLSAIQKHCQEEQAKFYPAIRRFLNPQMYLAGLEKSLFDLKLRLIDEIQTRES